MSIRFATLDDIDIVVGYWRECHAGSRFRHLAFDEVKFAAHMRRVIEDRSGVFCVLLADEGTETAIGVLVGQIEAYYFSNDPVAKSLFHWIHPRHRAGSVPLRLLLAFKQWAVNRRAREVLVRFDGDAADRQSEATTVSIGFQPLGGNYVFAIAGSEAGE